MNHRHYLGLKDIAQRLQLHPRSVKRWWKRLNVPPTIPGHSCHRWSPEDADKLAARLAEFWKTRNSTTTNENS